MMNLVWLLAAVAMLMAGETQLCSWSPRAGGKLSAFSVGMLCTGLINTSV
jgi:hypothetical protein